MTFCSREAPHTRRFCFSLRIVQKIEDWLADDAVCCEPISQGNSLSMTGKNREFHDFYTRSMLLSAKRARDYTVFQKIPQSLQNSEIPQRIREFEFSDPDTEVRENTLPHCRKRASDRHHCRADNIGQNPSGANQGQLITVDIGWLYAGLSPNFTRL